ncbi:hypothetical protein QOT17_015370 [Balamuthia mandrillaris]
METASLVLVSFTEGSLSNSKLAKVLFLKNELSIGPAELSLFQGLADLPWMLKPLIYCYCLAVPLWGFHHRSYLCLASLLAVACTLSLCFGAAATPLHVFLALLGRSAAAAVMDLLMDDLVVARLNRSTLQEVHVLQTACAVAAALGSLFSSYGSGWLFAHLSLRSIMLMDLFLAASTLSLAFFISETPSASSPSSSSWTLIWQETKAVFSSILSSSSPSTSTTRQAALFMMLWMSFPAAATAVIEVVTLFLLTSPPLGFSAAQLGDMQFAVRAAKLIMLWLFGFRGYVARMKPHTMLLSALFVSLLLLLPSFFILSSSSSSSSMMVTAAVVGQSLSSLLIYRAAVLLSTIICNNNNKTERNEEDENNNNNESKRMWVMLMAMMNVAEDLIQPLLVSIILWSGGIERMDEGSKDLNLSFASLARLWLSVIATFGVPLFWLLLWPFTFQRLNSTKKSR